MNVIEFIEKIKQFETIEQFKKSVGFFLSRCGFDSWAYTVKFPDSYNNGTFETMHNWNQEFVDRYVNIHMPHCPRFKHLWNSPVPLVYDREFFKNDLKMLPVHPEPVKKVIDDIIDFRYHGHGFSLVTHGKYGDKGVLTLQNRDQRRDGLDAITLSFHVANAFFPFMHMKYIELTGWRPPGGVFELTEREKECLRWAADGKTSWETGMILNVSERTVNFHLANAQKKLMATNKIQAVARAILYHIL
ncbi:MAG: autoinducer binding domain-containing protein [Magnetococcales bacterium]|nr:autoinducer binding domain-containing protein [Magnetococcales bacterium]